MFLILIVSQSDFVSAKAVITDFEQTSPEVDKVLIKCSVEGNPSPDVTWYLGNTRLPDKRKYPDYDVTAAASLRVPTAAVVLHVFLCNCSNPQWQSWQRVSLNINYYFSDCINQDY